MVHPHQKAIGNPNNRNKLTSTVSLHDRLHTLLLNLTSTSKILQKWPDSQGDNASIHIDTTTKLIHSLQRIIHSLKNVEVKSLTRLATDDKRATELKKRLREYQVPLDLLDLMDYGHAENDSYHLFGLNPDCFIRGLLREALRQLAGLKRRKVALEMLGKAIEKGIQEREAKNTSPIGKDAQPPEDGNEKKSKKRDRNEVDGIGSNDVTGINQLEADFAEEPPAKRKTKIV